MRLVKEDEKRKQKQNQMKTKSWFSVIVMALSDRVSVDGKMLVKKQKWKGRIKKVIQ